MREKISTIELEDVPSMHMDPFLQRLGRRLFFIPGFLLLGGSQAFIS